MASIYDLNHPQNSFWDNLISGLEDHPFFAPRAGGPHHAPPHHHGPPPFWGWGGPGNPGSWGWVNPAQNNDGASGPQASRAAEQNNEPTAGPSTSTDNRDAEKEQGSSDTETDNTPGRHGHCGKGKHHKGRGGPPHGPGRGCGGRGRGGPGHHHRACHGPPGGGPFGHPFAPPFGGHPRGRGPHRRGRHAGRGGWHHGGPPPAGGPGFDFLRNLAAQFGISLNQPTPENVDFVPTVDVFDTPAKYLVHVSLPGAKKDDLSIDYDADESVLRLAGVVYRPGINEDLHQALVMEERAREVGVFEREVRLGTRESPATVSVDELTAKLEDGVLSVVLPKIVSEPEPKKKVVVEDGDVEMEKDAMHVDESRSVTMTPEGSDSEEEEEEAKEYVKVPVE